MAVSNVNLMGPNPAQPFDIQTEQARLAIQQQIAQALLQQGMSPTQMLDTGAVKSANWGDALGKIAQTYFGRRGIDEVSGQQQDLARRANEMYQTDVGKVFGAMQPHEEGGAPDIMGEGAQLALPGGPNIGGRQVPGSVMAGVGEAAKSLHPEVQKIAGSLMQAYLKQMVTPENILSAVGRGEVDPKTLPPAMAGTNMLIHPELLGKQPKMEKGTGGAMAEFTPTARPGERLQPSGTVQPPPSPITSAEGSGIGLPTQRTPEGTTQVVPGSAEAPQVMAQKKNAEDQLKVLEGGKVQAQSFAKAAPVFQQMIQLIDSSNMGFGGEWIRQARKAAVRLGVSDDEAQNINSLETLMKYALPQAAHAARDFNARSTQLEFINFKEALGADPSIDPRTARNIFMYGLVEGLNGIETHRKNIATAAVTPTIGPQMAKQYDIPFKTPVDAISLLDQAKVPVNLQQDTSTSMWRNEEIQKQIEKGAAARAAKRPADIPKNWVMMEDAAGNKAWANPANPAEFREAK